MGTTPYGINGPTRGKVGKTHGSSRYGKPYIKGPHKKRKKNVSAKELANRDRFKETNAWLKPLTLFVREGFKGFVYKKESQGYVAAYSHLIANALVGEKPNQKVDPALVQVSYGNLPLPNNIAVEVISSRVLKFSWDKAYVTDGSKSEDQVMVLAYDLEHRHAVMNLTGQFRSVGEDYQDIGLIKEDRTFHIYVAFVSADRTIRSHSVYLGTITMPQNID